MRLRVPLMLAALLLLTCSVARAQEEPLQNNEQVIDDFVLTRGVSFEEPGKKKQQQGSPASPSSGNKSGKSSGGVASTKPPRKVKRVKGGMDPKSGMGGGPELAAMSADASDPQFVK